MEAKIEIKYLDNMIHISDDPVTITIRGKPEEVDMIIKSFIRSSIFRKAIRIVT